MQRFLLRFAALATTVTVLYGKASGRPSPLGPPIIGPTVIRAPPASVPNAFDIPTQSDTILTVGGTTLPNAPTSRIPCSPSCPACNASLTQGNMLRLGLAPIHGLNKRTLRTPADYNGDTTRFVLSEFAFAEILSVRGGRGTEATGFARELKNYAFDAAIRGLYGCTSVVVVSKSAMWLSHFWEVPSFRATQANWRRRAQPASLLDIDNFNEQVLDQMQDGGPYITGLRQFTAPGGYFSGAEEPTWIIVTPEAPPGIEGRYEYSPEVRAMENVLRDLFPNAPRVIVDYIPRTDERAQATTATGKILVQYDPLQDYIPLSTNSCFDYQQAIIRVWVEDRPRPVLEHTWIAKGTQLVDGSPVDRRQKGKRDGSACLLPSILP